MDPGKVMIVNQTTSIDIRCDIESIEGSFRGELKNEQGTSRSFSGWTEFASALMELAGTKSTETQTEKLKQEKSHEEDH
jgi:hypothetical protein